eukprot:GFUD01080456.1.p1 GENE.GFUD01080456.1~~GFUD01080456.1.p1  ORF type:complete len:345 (+),score=56.88 GFUD01080456.1:27-1037(+)
MFSSLLFLTYITVSQAEYPSHDSCKKPSISWNALSMDKLVMNIDSYELCAKTCKDTNKQCYENKCNYFTWNDGNHQYFRNSCALFKSPGDEQECKNCMSGAASCFCASPFACQDTGDNVAFVHTDTESWSKCEEHCNINFGCSSFTWFTEDHPYRHLCILYKECSQSEVDTTCSGCCSGVRSKKSPCSQSQYKELSSAHRSVHAEGGKNRDMSYIRDVGGVKSADWRAMVWYRFTGEAGTKMAEQFPGWDKCGTTWPGYLAVDNDSNKYNDYKLSLPTQEEGEKEMTVCFARESERDKCYYIENVMVMNCADYFVYQLTNVGTMRVGNDKGGYCGE